MYYVLSAMTQTKFHSSYYLTRTDVQFGFCFYFEIEYSIINILHIEFFKCQSLRWLINFKGYLIIIIIIILVSENEKIKKSQPQALRN